MYVLTTHTHLMIDNLNTKIVGVRYYRGHATLGEHVALKRQPDNQYDANAIRVDNVMGQQIGHIPRNMAAKLAKYMVAL
jgi:SWI/SNF-related matrix-associated actin-dependent regulator of chromatin subfamily A3